MKSLKKSAPFLIIGGLILSLGAVESPSLLSMLLLGSVGLGITFAGVKLLNYKGVNNGL
ncbi:MAG: hypothetical protein IBX55_13025 [Methyloprofundus sp.]|nr:hypothetical protein [Methyloprofundus sp.]